MNPTRSSRKSLTPKREPKGEKAKNTLKTDKETSKVKSNASSRFDEDNLNRKHRSGSVSRQNAIKFQESPRKAQSVDRNRQKVTNAPSSKDIQKTSSKIQNDVRKKIDPSIASSSRHQSNAISKSVDNQNDRDINGQKKTSSKNVERRNSKQVAKSFVKSSEAKTKVSKTRNLHRNDSKKVDDSHSKNSSKEDSLLERPRTSTIRKGVPKSISSTFDNDNNAKESKSLKSSSSRSKTSLNGESENDKSSYEEDFEDYDSDFEESDVDSESESNSTSSSMEEQETGLNAKEETPHIEHTSQAPEEKPAINTVTKKVEKVYLNLSDRSSLFHEKSNVEQSDSKPIKLSRSFINFTSPVEGKEDVNKEIRQNSLNNEDDHFQVIDEALQPTYNYLTKSNSKQVFVQTENSEEDEIQTDDIETCNKWTQNPSNGTIGYGGDKNESADDKVSSWKSLFNVNSTKLSAFVKRSSDIIMTLLDEEFSDFSINFKTKQRPNFFYSDGFYVLSPLNILSGIPIVNMYSSDCSPYIITIHGSMVQVPTDNEMNDEKGIICVWNTLESKQPKYILTGNSQPTCGTFGPGGYDIVIAGMTDGAVMLWDLTLLNSSPFQVEVGGSLALLPPTYNTALMFGCENPSSCVVQVQTVYSRSREDWRSFGSERRVSTRNFHVLTLEDMGVLKIWVVVEVLKPDISGLESDLGMAPGGKYRLVQSSCLLLYNLPALQMEQKISIRTFDFRVVPFDASRMLVTTDAGIILHVTRHSGGVEPRFYSNETAASEIRCIDYSPHNEDLFLVGCSDGSITLFNIKLVHPIKEFLQGGKGEPVNLLRWSIVHPTIFCVLSSTSHIHLWNIMEDSTHPLYSYDFGDCKITWFVFKSVHQTSSHLAKKKNSNFIISKENGEVEVHTFLLKNFESEFKTQLEYLQNF